MKQIQPTENFQEEFQEYVDFINEIQPLHHQAMKDKGFWNGEYNFDEKIMLIISELGEAVEAMRKGRYIKPNFETIEDVKDTYEEEIADVILRWIDLSEFYKLRLSQTIAWNNTVSVFQVQRHICKRLSSMSMDYEIKPSDVAYIHRRLFALSQHTDIKKVIKIKMAYNATRPPKHGKNF